jgi:regulator of replication initiation timing
VQFDVFSIKNAELPENKFKIIPNGNSDASNVASIRFSNCNLAKFPDAEIFLDVAKELTYLELLECKLTKVTREDLRGLGNLKTLHMGRNEIGQLPKGLFDFTPNLEFVSFHTNNIKDIDADILEPLKNLKYFNLLNNTSINVKYDINNEGNVTMAELKEAIKKCDPTEKFKVEMKMKIEAVTKEMSELKKENAAVNKENQSLKGRFDELEMNYDELKNDFKRLKEMKEKQIICDFTVSINGKAFHVNKDILAANSPVLKRLIEENPDADQLKLDDLTEKTFEAILNFMYSKNPPNNATNPIELFAASARLQMKELMDMTAEILMEKVNPDNAPEIIILCKKYGNDQLRKKAFNELKKDYTDDE